MYLAISTDHRDPSVYAGPVTGNAGSSSAIEGPDPDWLPL